MNPLLSLSFSGQAPGPAAGPMVAAEPETAAQNKDNASRFGGLLAQSSEQQAPDRQSFAGGNPTHKSKRPASMEGALPGRPEITLPPVIPPAAILLVATEPDTVQSDATQHDSADKMTAAEHAANEKNTTALLGLLDLASQAKQQLAAQAEAKAEPASVKKAVSLAVAAAIPAPDAKKSEEGEWTTLPVYPELAAIDIANGSTLADGIKASTGKTEAASGENNLQKPELKLNPTDASRSLAEQALANQATAKTVTKPVTDKPGVEADVEADNATQMDPAKDKLTAAPASAGAVATNIENSAAAEQAETGPAIQAATQRASTGAAPAANADAATILQAGAGATIFDKPTATIFESQNADSSSVAASSLASTATVADSAMARQQQRAALAEGVNQTKQALAASADAVDPKADTAASASGQRPEATLSGFANVFSQSGHTQSEAVAARMDAATMASALQSGEQTKASQVSKSVTEQLKQVNLLAQNAAGQLKERINLMVRQNIQVAEIRLDPADLGQMQIRVNLQQEQATVQFIVQQQHAKELLEQQMPRLREMLQQQGIQLGEGQVQQQRQGDSQASSQGNGRAGAGHGDQGQATDEHATAVQLEVKLSERLVDYYA